jgi:hypothetical protein
MNPLSGELTFVDASGWIALVNANELYRKGWQLYRERLDKDWGVIDCISFAIMQERGIVETLTGDRHFQQAGFVALL